MLFPEKLPFNMETGLKTFILYLVQRWNLMHITQKKPPY